MLQNLCQVKSACYTKIREVVQGIPNITVLKIYRVAALAEIVRSVGSVKVRIVNGFHSSRELAGTFLENVISKISGQVKTEIKNVENTQISLLCNKYKELTKQQKEEFHKLIQDVKYIDQDVKMQVAKFVGSFNYNELPEYKNITINNQSFNSQVELIDFINLLLEQSKENASKITKMFESYKELTKQQEEEFHKLIQDVKYIDQDVGMARSKFFSIFTLIELSLSLNNREFPALPDHKKITINKETFNTQDDLINFINYLLKQTKKTI
jgi:hypothetical protein